MTWRPPRHKGEFKNRVEIPGVVCYAMDTVNEHGCLKGEPMDRQPKKQPITAAYKRLSRDDERENESVSIEY